MRQAGKLLGGRAHSRSLGYLRIFCQRSWCRVDLVRLSLKKAAYVAPVGAACRKSGVRLTKGRVVTHPIFRVSDGGIRGVQLLGGRAHSRSPFDFAQGRLSATSEFPVKGRGVGRSRAAFLKESRTRGRWLVQRVGNPESARDDKVEDGGPAWHWWRWMDGAVRSCGPRSTFAHGRPLGFAPTARRGRRDDRGEGGYPSHIPRIGWLKPCFRFGKTQASTAMGFTGVAESAGRTNEGRMLAMEA